MTGLGFKFHQLFLIIKHCPSVIKFYNNLHLTLRSTKSGQQSTKIMLVKASKTGFINATATKRSQ